MNSQEYNISLKIPSSVSRNMMAVGVLLVLASIGLIFVVDGIKAKHYFHSYLFVFAFYFSIVFGSLFFVILQHLTRSEWSVVVRRIAETFMKNIELMIVLSIPVFFGVFDLYHWTHPEEVANDKILQGKAGYLNLTFFFIRIVIYFVVGFFIARFYYRASVFQDKSGEQSISVKMQKFAPLSTIVFGLVISFFALDFLMTLNPHWYSTIWGIYYFAGSMVVSLSLITLVALGLRKIGLLKSVITVEHYHDLGKLLFSFNIFWAYVAFSQYMLIWYANIPEGTIFFIDRINGTWLNVSILLIVGHVFVPIICFVSRNAKRSMTIQLLVTLWLVFMHMVDVYWVVMPGVNRTGINISLVDIFNIVGVGLLFFGYFLRNFSRESIVAYNDPRIENSINFINH